MEKKYEITVVVYKEGLKNLPSLYEYREQELGLQVPAPEGCEMEAVCFLQFNYRSIKFLDHICGLIGVNIISVEEEEETIEE